MTEFSVSKNFKGEKLLVLGANSETIPLIKEAQRLGVRVVVADPSVGSPAKKYADFSWELDGIDVSGLKSACRSEGVRGIMVGVADRLVEPYARLCSELEKPFLGSLHGCRVLTDKALFSSACSTHGLKTIPRFSESELGNCINSGKAVFIKPVDSNSGKGMSICRTFDEVQAGKEKALRSSKSKSIFIERYMECNDVLINLTIVDGSVFVSGVADRFTVRQKNDASRVCIGAIYPSVFTQAYIDKVHCAVVHLLKDLEVKNGILTIQAFVEDGEFFFYDPGFRLQGEGCDKHFQNTLGYDQKEMLVHFALTGEMRFTQGNWKKTWDVQGPFSATVWVLSREGTIKEIRGLESISCKKGCFNIFQRLFPGDVITSEMVGTEAQVVARIYCSESTRERLAELIDNIRNELIITGENGEELNIPTIFGDNALRPWCL